MSSPTPSTIADLITVAAVAAFAWVVWPPATLLVIAAAAAAYSWRHR